MNKKARMNVRTWTIFALLGFEDKKKQNQFLPLIERRLKEGIYITEIVKEIGILEQGRKSVEEGDK